MAVANIDKPRAGSWDASAFFQALTEHNMLSRSLDFQFYECSGLEGFEGALQATSIINMICVSDISDGYIELNNSPKTRSVKTVFMAMRHAIDDMQARSRCMDTMREIFRQFMSRLIREKTKLQESCIYLDDRISFTEIDRFFFNGSACAYFQIAVDIFTDLRLRPAEWSADSDKIFSQTFNRAFS